MAEWWSIEVFSGDKLPASGWRYAYEDELTEAAITHGAMYYEWHDTEYGVIFEVLFWIPRVLPGRANHFNWGGNAISVAIAGAAWVVADSIGRAEERRAPAYGESDPVSAPA